MGLRRIVLRENSKIPFKVNLKPDSNPTEIFSLTGTRQNFFRLQEPGPKPEIKEKRHTI